MASRTTVRLTPNSSMIEPSVGNLAPACSCPLRTRSPSAWTRSVVSELGLRRAVEDIGSCIMSYNCLSQAAVVQAHLGVDLVDVLLHTLGRGVVRRHVGPAHLAPRILA